MEQLIKQIIKVDKQARKKTAQSKEQLAQSKIAIAERVKELEEQYNRSIEEIIELTTQEELEKVQTKKAALDSKYAEANAVLDRTFLMHKDEWAKELAQRAAKI